MHTQRRVADGIALTAVTRESICWILWPGQDWQPLNDLKDAYTRATGDLPPVLIAWGPRPPQDDLGRLITVEPVEERRFLVVEPPRQKREAQWKNERRNWSKR